MSKCQSGDPQARLVYLENRPYSVRVTSRFAMFGHGFFGQVIDTGDRLSIERLATQFRAHGYRVQVQPMPEDET